MFKRTTLYITISKNRVEIKNINTKRTTIVDDCIFSNEHYLIAEFSVLAQRLEASVQKVMQGGFNLFAPYVVVQPMELVSEPLSEIEKKVLTELIENVFSRQPMLWVGDTLSDEQVKHYSKQSFQDR